MKMLFNVETYRFRNLFLMTILFFMLYCITERPESCRAAMMEFEINLSEMPLGKLSKSNIQKGAYIKLYQTLCLNTSWDFLLVIHIHFTCIKKFIGQSYMVIICFSGFEALTQIQNLLKNTDYDPTVKESLIVDASNKFFTVIPSIHPHVIRDEDDFKLKVHSDAANSICFVLGCFSVLLDLWKSCQSNSFYYLRPYTINMQQ